MSWFQSSSLTSTSERPPTRASSRPVHIFRTFALAQWALALTWLVSNFVFEGLRAAVATRVMNTERSRDRWPYDLS